MRSTIKYPLEACVVGVKEGGYEGEVGQPVTQADMGQRASGRQGTYIFCVWGYTAETQ